MARKFSYLFLFLFSPFLLLAQFQDILEGRNFAQIPFTYDANFIILNATLEGGIPLKFIFDTGAEHTLLFKKTYTDLLGANYTKKIRVYGSDLSVFKYAFVTRNIRLKLSPLPEVRLDILVLEEDYLNMDQLTGLTIDGIIGASFFKHYVVKVDYARQLLTLYRSSNFKKPSGKYYEYPMVLNHYKPYIKAKSHFNQTDSAEITLLLDTGAGLSIMLNTNSNPNIKLPGNAIESRIGNGLGGNILGYMGKLNRLDVFMQSWPDILTNFQEIQSQEFERLVNNRNGIIGNQILSRFTLIIDYPKELLYLKPRKRINAKFNYDKSGLFLAATGPSLREFYVIHVVERSPAANAGIRRGDQIIKMSGQAMFLASLSSIMKKLKKKEGKRIKLKIRRDGDIIKKEFLLRALL